MDLMKIGVELLQKQLSGSTGSGESNSSAGIVSALSSLLGDGKGGLDLGAILGKMQGGDLAGMASSWMGSGSNDSIGGDQLRELFGNDKISQFAAQLGLDEGSALSGLSDMLPNMMDQGSPDGSLLDSLGGLGGLASVAKKFLG